MRKRIGYERKKEIYARGQRSFRLILLACAACVLIGNYFYTKSGHSVSEILYWIFTMGGDAVAIYYGYYYFCGDMINDLEKEFAREYDSSDVEAVLDGDLITDPKKKEEYRKKWDRCRYFDQNIAAVMLVAAGAFTILSQLIVDRIFG